MSAVLRRDISQADREFLESLTPKKVGRMFWASPWQMCEAEEMARQTLFACKNNLKDHGDPFSWLGNGTRTFGGGGLVNNPEGLARITDTGYLVIEDAPDGLQPTKSTIYKDGKPQVLRLTEKFMAYARSEAAK